MHSLIANGQATTASLCGTGNANADWYNLGYYSAGQNIELRLDFNNPAATLHMEIYTGIFRANSAPQSGSHTLNYSAAVSGNYRVLVYPNANTPGGTMVSISEQSPRRLWPYIVSPSSIVSGMRVRRSEMTSRAMTILLTPTIWPHMDPDASRTRIVAGLSCACATGARAQKRTRRQNESRRRIVKPVT